MLEFNFTKILKFAPLCISNTDPNAGYAKQIENGGDDMDDDEEEMGELPPKLPMPVGKMNCSVTRYGLLYIWNGSLLVYTWVIDIYCPCP